MPPPETLQGPQTGASIPGCTSGTSEISFEWCQTDAHGHSRCVAHLAAYRLPGTLILSSKSVDCMNAVTRGMLTVALSSDSELTDFERACFRHLVDSVPGPSTNTITVEPPRPRGELVPKRSGPEWLRLPPPGRRCPHTGLSRTTLCELTMPSPTNENRPPVKSVVIRKRGALRGIRLISYDSLMKHLESLST